MILPEAPFFTRAWLTLNHTILIFNNPRKKSHLENIVGNGENAGNQHFLTVFYPFKDRNHHISNVKFIVCRC